MYRIFILEYAPIVLLACVAVSATIKLIKVVNLKHADNFTEIFLRSFFLYSRDEIKNTSHSSLKNFYKSNNKFNTLFYVAVISIVFLYTLMHIIS